MLHWYMTNPEYRKFEPPELKIDTKLSNEEDSSENEQNENNSASPSIIETITVGLTRSLSAASKRGRSKSLRAKPTSNNHSLNKLTLKSENETLNNSTTNIPNQTNKKTVYLN